MRRAPGKLEKAVATAVNAAWWLTATDQPAIDAVKLQSRIIDEIRRHHEESMLPSSTPLAETESSMTYRLDVLQRGLDALGLSPKGRKELSIEPVQDADDLAAIFDIPVS